MGILFFYRVIIYCCSMSMLKSSH